MKKGKMFSEAALCLHISRLNDRHESIKNVLWNGHTLLGSAYSLLPPGDSNFADNSEVDYNGNFGSGSLFVTPPNLSTLKVMDFFYLDVSMLT